MGILTKIEEQSHIVVPVFFLLLLYINNMPIDFNIKVLNLQEIFPLAPKATYKNILMITSFSIFLLLFETLTSVRWPKYIGFIIILLASIVPYLIYLLSGKENIKNGEVDGLLKGYINDIKIDDWKSALINGVVATLMIIGIFFMFYRLDNGWGSGKFSTLIISIPVILCLSILYLKADGLLGLLYAGIETIKEKYHEVLKLPWYDWLYIIFIGLLLLWTFIGGRYSRKTWLHYLNPYATLAKDTNHPALVVLILLLFSYKFRYKGFLIFTILVVIWDKLYDKFPIVKNHMKISLLAFFILFLFIDSRISKKMINDKGNDIKDKDKSK
jgi:hypothetical protein